MRIGKCGWTGELTYLHNHMKRLDLHNDAFCALRFILHFCRHDSHGTSSLPPLNNSTSCLITHNYSCLISQSIEYQGAMFDWIRRQRGSGAGLECLHPRFKRWPIADECFDERSYRDSVACYRYSMRRVRYLEDWCRSLKHSALSEHKVILYRKVSILAITLMLVCVGLRFHKVNVSRGNVGT